MRKISGVIGRIRTGMGGDRLSGTYYRFLAVHTGYMIYTGLPGVFVSTFLMSQTKSMDVVLIYNMLNFTGTAFGMLLSADAVHRFHPGVASVLGIFGNNLLYLQLIFFNTQSASHVVLLGLTGGLAGSFYWISYSQLLTEYTDLNSRDSGMAIISIMSSIVNLIVPFLSGTIISAVGRTTGYNVVFGLAFVIGVITAIGAIRLPKLHTKAQKSAQHKKALQLVFHQKVLRFGLMSEGFKGIREGAFGFILSILLYRLIQSEMLIGFNTFLSAGVSILSFLIISRKIVSSNRIKFMKIALVSLLAFGILCVFTISPLMLILFTLVNAFFSGFIVNSSFGTFLDGIQMLPQARDLRPELFAFKEICLATGRCLGILIIMAIDRLSGGDLTWQAVSLVILTLTQVVTVFASKKGIQLIEEIKLSRCA